MDHAQKKQPALDQQTRRQMVAQHLRDAARQEQHSELARRYLWSALAAAVLMPPLFYLRFGEVSWFAIGFTVFLVVLCLLAALGFYFQDRRSFHTAVRSNNSLADRIGAFWLMACAFGPLLGWFITVFPPTTNSWRWQYCARIFFAIVVPVITAVPLLRYARGRAALIALPLLVVITVLPMFSCWWVIADLHDGPKVIDLSFTREAFTRRLICDRRSVEYDLPCYAAAKGLDGAAARVTWLQNTGRVIEVKRI